MRYVIKLKKKSPKKNLLIMTGFDSLLLEDYLMQKITSRC